MVGMEGLAVRLVVGSPGIPQLQLRESKPSVNALRIPKSLCIGRPLNVFPRLGYKVRALSSHHNAPAQPPENPIQRLQCKLGRISNWVSMLQHEGNSNRTEVKQEIGRVSLLLIAAAVFVLNASGRFCRPALSAPAVSPTELYDKWGHPKAKLEEKEQKVIEHLKTHPKDVQALKVVLYSRMSKGDTDKAMKIIERLMFLEPYDLQWRFLKAQLHEFKGQVDEAKRGFRELLEIEPFSIQALQALAMVMHNCGEDETMMEMLEGTLERALQAKKETEAYNLKLLLGHMYIVQDDLEKALEHYQRLVDEKPNDFRPYLCQGIVYSALDKKDEAEQKFEKYRKLVPEDFEMRGLLDEVMWSAKTESGKLYKEQKKKEELLAQGKTPQKPMKQPTTGVESTTAVGEPKESEDGQVADS